VRAVVQRRRLEAAGPGGLPRRRCREEQDAHQRVGQFPPQRFHLQFLPGHPSIARQRLPAPGLQRQAPRNAGDGSFTGFPQRVEPGHGDAVSCGEKSPDNEQRRVAADVQERGDDDDTGRPGEHLSAEQHVMRVIEGAVRGDAAVGERGVGCGGKIHGRRGASAGGGGVGGAPGQETAALPHPQPHADGGDEEHEGNKEDARAR